jgi:hypothetical protein
MIKVANLSVEMRIANKVLVKFALPRWGLPKSAYPVRWQTKGHQPHPDPLRPKRVGVRPRSIAVRTYTSATQEKLNSNPVAGDTKRKSLHHKK